MKKVFENLRFFVCFLQDDLSNLSEEKDFGDVTVSLHNEDILPEYTIRTMKVLSVSNIVAQSDTECIRLRLNLTRVYERFRSNFVKLLSA